MTVCVLRESVVIQNLCLRGGNSLGSGGGYELVVWVGHSDTV